MRYYPIYPSWKKYYPLPILYPPPRLVGSVSMGLYHYYYYGRHIPKVKMTEIILKSIGQPDIRKNSVSSIKQTVHLYINISFIRYRSIKIVAMSF